jgi:FkbH-like protein
VRHVTIVSDRVRIPMFEFEVDYQPVSLSDVPRSAVEQFELGERDLVGLSPLLWEEHCTECAMPQCYQSCDLYTPRKDGKCRRFLGGAAPVKGVRNRTGYVTRVTFKVLGSLLATGRLGSIPLPVLSNLERHLTSVESIARSIPDSTISVLGRRGLSSRLAGRYKRMRVRGAIEEAQDPDCFMGEFFNPAAETVEMTFVVRAVRGEKTPMPFQKKIELPPGFTRVQIPWSSIVAHVDPGGDHWISLTPNRSNADKDITLFIGTLGFACLTSAAMDNGERNSKVVKVAVWDLDNTVWDGILVEDGPDCISLRPGIKDVIAGLDARGIVNSVVSKNHHTDAWTQLERFDLAEYFVFPQISWSPKSRLIKAIIKDFNVGEEAVAFIDDSPFEREEVLAAAPAVRVYDAADYHTLLDRPEFSPQLSDESAKRREYYQTQGRRAAAEAGFVGDYIGFLRSCQMRMLIGSVTPENIDRVHELIQRTNQMNFSGNRYTRDDIERLLQDHSKRHFALSCADKYGDYGVVGYCMVDDLDTTVIDLAFSCRVQSKRVEHAFLTWLLEYYRSRGRLQLKANFNRTAKNAPVGAVFQDLAFVLLSHSQSRYVYGHLLNHPFSGDGIISIKVTI